MYIYYIYILVKVVAVPQVSGEVPIPIQNPVKYLRWNLLQK